MRRQRRLTPVGIAPWLRERCGMFVAISSSGCGCECECEWVKEYKYKVREMPDLGSSRMLGNVLMQEINGGREEKPIGG